MAGSDPTSLTGDRVAMAADRADPNPGAPHSPAQSRKWPEYAAGGGASFLAILVTYPLHKTMFRQQMHNISVLSAVQQLRSEGAGHIYRGLFSPLLMRVLTQSIMFGSYSQYSRLLRDHFSLPVRPSQVLGAVLAGVSEAALMPLERVQALMQAKEYHTRFRNTPDAFLQLRVHGPSEYYRGLSAILLRNCLGNTLFFTARETMKERLPDAWKASAVSSTMSDFVTGAFLGALISTIFYPVNVTKNHMQVVIGGRFLRFRDVFRHLLSERGFKQMYNGIHANYTRSFLSWGIINVSYEYLLKVFRRTESSSASAVSSPASSVSTDPSQSTSKKSSWS